MPHYWLMKSEPDEVSTNGAPVTPRATVPSTGVRNDEARNIMRDAMRPRDGVPFYHSSRAQPGIAGIARVALTACPDPIQFDPKSPYFDSRPDAPRWLLVDVKVLRKTRRLTLPERRAEPALARLRVLQKGNRLSIAPV
ncbi:MAG: EVE domain-containing protein [Curvibacter sp.]|jgi:predicted RNA-binding protein with PUA-like domain|nr:EVE domain-containing protein [Curvibacter sp.]